jgi:N-acetyl-gamma-glutamyl-phosphate reductase
MKVGIAGASGFAGAELLRLCAGHPELDVVAAGGDARAGEPVRDLYPSLAGAYPDLVFTAISSSDLVGLDVVFLALPHGASQHVAPDLVDNVGVLVDLSADFRLRAPDDYVRWYGEDHTAPALLERFAYGLPELFRKDLVGARLVAAPGCYPTAAALALTPLVREGLVEPLGVIVDAASGVSGAGSKLVASNHFNAVDEDFTAYGLLHHRHTPEIEQATGAEVLFTPHLVPMNRGILATCYARPTEGVTSEAVADALAAAYEHERFVIVSDASPSTKATLGSNCAHVTSRVDERTGWAVILCALDNLTKGASGQALQCANLALGIPEHTGLAVTGLYP